MRLKEFNSCACNVAYQSAEISMVGSADNAPSDSCPLVFMPLCSPLPLSVGYI